MQQIQTNTQANFAHRLRTFGKFEHRSKGLSNWRQFVAMLFCQLGRAHPLHEIDGSLKSFEG
jgi:hypothetical protein